MSLRDRKNLPAGRFPPWQRRPSSAVMPRALKVEGRLGEDYRGELAEVAPMSCCLRLTASTSDQTSTIRPHLMRKILIPVQVAMRPEGGRSPNCPCWVPTGRVALHHVVVLHDKLIEGVTKIGKRSQKFGHHRRNTGCVHYLGIAASRPHARLAR
jgi:hypothetical protein